jgi:hypothetical protein
LGKAADDGEGHVNIHQLIERFGLSGMHPVSDESQLAELKQLIP